MKVIQITGCNNCLNCKPTEKIAKFLCTYDNKINDVDVTDVKRSKLRTIPQECPVRKATMMTNESFYFIQLLNC